MVVFSLLLIVLVVQHYRGVGRIGRLPILIASITIVNGVSAILRTWALFPIFGFTQRYEVFSTFYLLEDVSFYLAIWLFGMKYYEVSLDLERILTIG